MSAGNQFQPIEISSLNSFCCSLGKNLGVACGKLRLLIKGSDLPKRGKAILRGIKTSFQEGVALTESKSESVSASEPTPASAAAETAPSPEATTPTESGPFTYDQLQSKTKAQLRELLETRGVTDSPSSATKEDLISDILEKQKH